MFRKPKPNTVKLDEAHAEREQVKRAFEAMKTELEQASSRVDVVLERLRKKSNVEPLLRLVRVK